MSDDAEGPPVVFKVRLGRQQFTCTGHLVWEGGLVYAVGEDADDGFYAPERVRLEESDLELKHDSETGRDWYQYHGFIVLPDTGGF